MAQVCGQLVHVAPGARQAMPGNDRISVLRSPLGVMNFPPSAGQVMGCEWHFNFLMLIPRGQPAGPGYFINLPAPPTTVTSTKREPSRLSGEYPTVVPPRS